MSKPINPNTVLLELAAIFITADTALYVAYNSFMGGVMPIYAFALLSYTFIIAALVFIFDRITSNKYSRDERGLIDSLRMVDTALFTASVLAYSFVALMLEERLFGSNYIVWVPTARADNAFMDLYYVLDSTAVPYLEFALFVKRLPRLAGPLKACAFFAAIQALGALNVMVMLYQVAINAGYYALVFYLYRRINNVKALLAPFVIYLLIKLV
ncbi:hypothetical protein GCM10007981_01040 [Thermocladium modestius]|uniref:Uncharacterized protein n=1 Tax=Thermocladium modestius TaxID=62609 RepID=A0A830GSV4_9CREN|nr:hypothetical protein [Thermocladium modestius]GGP19025.1 hypothetical protein GCM10007981_01040 [Thermocladium modestius]